MIEHGQVQACADFRVVALAGAELELVEPDQPRLGARARRRLQARDRADDRSRKSADWPRPSPVVEMPASRSGPGARSTLRASGCGSCGVLVRLVAAGDVDQHAAVLDLDRIGGHAVFLEAGLAHAGAAVEFPVVPGTDDVVAVEPAFAERAADVIAGVRHRAERPVLERDRESRVLHVDAAAAASWTARRRRRRRPSFHLRAMTRPP